MASTFTNLNYHVVIGTKHRRNLITPDLCSDLYSYVGGIIRSKGGVLLEIGGVGDHIHILAGFAPTIAVSDMVRFIKSNSSKWVNERAAQVDRFQWQTGYGAFTVSHSQVEVVRRYIQNQEEHHRKRTFREEFLAPARSARDSLRRTIRVRAGACRMTTTRCRPSGAWLIVGRPFLGLTPQANRFRPSGTGARSFCERIRVAAERRQQLAWGVSPRFGSDWVRTAPEGRQRTFLARFAAFATLLVALVAASTPIAAADVSAEQLALVKRAEAARVRVVKKIRPAVVAVFGNNRRGGGSGVLFDASGLALTNHHVVAAAGVEGWAGLADGKLYRWKLIGTDPGGDVAVIRLSGKKPFPFAPLGRSEDVRAGDWVMALGNPFTLAEDYTPTVTLGIVSGVHRYQRGSGRNMLVYGNCIQVDSSINPGNSGGPLFNLKGEVVGINGRASFKERGRVNVGAGYAISTRQIRNFIPELMATKIARHGTLDATFSNRRAGVICDAVNLDSPAAKAGLQLADKLLRFDGEPIRNANQFTNLISMLPEGWPAELLVERDGKQHTIRVRLEPLNYGAAPKAPPRKGKKPRPKPRGARLDLTNAGLVRNAAVNRELCNLVLKKWAQHSGAAHTSALRVFEIRDDLFAAGKKVGTQTLTIASDGRFRVEVVRGDDRRLFVHDGRQTGEAVQLMLRDPFAVQAAALSGLLTANHVSPLYSTAELDACDKSQQQRSYRVRLSPASKAGRDAYLWLSQYDASGREEVRLLKSGIHVDGDEARPCMTCHDWKAVSGMQVPHRRRLVVGLAETPILELRTRSVRPLKSWPNGNR